MAVFPGGSSPSGVGSQIQRSGCFVGPLPCRSSEVDGSWFEYLAQAETARTARGKRFRSSAAGLYSTHHPPYPRHHLHYTALNAHPPVRSKLGVKLQGALYRFARITVNYVKWLMKVAGMGM